MSETMMQQVRNSYFLGYFCKCFELLESGQFDRSSEEYLSFLLRTRFKKREISHAQIINYAKSQKPSLIALGLYSAVSMMRDEPVNTKIIDQIDALSKTPDLTCRFICAASLACLGENKMALKLCENGSVEMLVLKSVIYLHLGKFDLLQTDEGMFDEDEVLGKLAVAWSCIADGSYKEAFLTFDDIHALCADEDMVEYDGSVMLLNGKAVCNMYRKLWTEALENLRKAYALNPFNSDTLVNLICCYRNLGKFEEANTYYKKLKNSYKDHFIVQKQEELEHLITTHSR